MHPFFQDRRDPTINQDQRDQAVVSLCFVSLSQICIMIINVPPGYYPLDRSEESLGRTLEEKALLDLVLFD